MQYASLILLLLCSITSVAQSFEYPVVVAEAKDVYGFVPKGWTILEYAIGELNGDKEDDMAMVLQYDDTVSFVNEFDTTVAQPRILVIVFKQGDAWRLVEQSNTFILMHDDPSMDEPFESIKIDGNVLKIAFRLWYSMGTYSVTNTEYKFRYQNNAFELIGAENYSFHRATHDNTEISYNFMTQKYCVIEENGGTGKAKTKWLKLPTGKLKTFKTVEKPYEWNVVGSYYL